MWKKSRPAGSYVRNAYLRGLEMQESGGFNPYRFGIVAASDTHVSGGSFDESNFHSKIGQFDGTPQVRGSVSRRRVDRRRAGRLCRKLLPVVERIRPGRRVGAGKYAGCGVRRVSAQGDLRHDRVPASKFGCFAGYELDDDLADAEDAAERAYDGGVPMGGRVGSRADRGAALPGLGRARPERRAARKVADHQGMGRGRRASGEGVRRCMLRGAEPDPVTHRCPDNGAACRTSSDCGTSGDGASELKVVWQDPGVPFLAGRAFYYVRVLENPTCRWSTWDAVKAGVAPRPDLPTTIQERAWTSPIWLEPQGLAH